jgi:hypothetical protein
MRQNMSTSFGRRGGSRTMSATTQRRIWAFWWASAVIVVPILLVPGSTLAIKGAAHSSNYLSINEMEDLAVDYGEFKQDPASGTHCSSGETKREGDGVYVILRQPNTYSYQETARVTVTLTSNSTKTKILEGWWNDYFVEVDLCQGCGCSQSSWRLRFTSTPNGRHGDPK